MNKCLILINELSSSVVLRYLKMMNINIYSIKYSNSNIYLLIDKNDLKIIANLCNYIVIKDYSIGGFWMSIKHSIFNIITFLLILSLVIIYSFFVVRIDILVSNNDIRDKIYNDLDRINIKPYSLRSSNNKLNNIKEYLLSNNKDTIEWLNIDRNGMSYSINIILKKDKEKINNKDYCNVISTKDSVISRINSSSGEEIVQVNDYVKKGDILISGDVIYNNLNKKVCASGSVYGKTWYTVNISIPKTNKYVKKLKHISNSYMVDDKYIWNSNNNDVIKEKKLLLNFYLGKLYVIKEYYKENKIYNYNDDEILGMMNKLINDKLKNMVDGKYVILNQNVLKKEDNNSTINIEIFLVLEEEIGIIS